MRLSGYQPQYFPRLHYFARALDSDIFEISDYLQFVKKHAFPMPDGTMKRGKSFQAHTPIKLHQGILYLTIPVRRMRLLPLNRTPIDYTHAWRAKHLASIRSGYAKAPNFQRLFPEITFILSRQYASLASLNVTTIVWAFAHILGADDTHPSRLSIDSVNRLLGRWHPFRLCTIILLSKTSIAPPGGDRDANDWILDMCRVFGAHEYYFGGTSAAAYMDFDKLRHENISLVEQQWRCPAYRQQFSTLEFLPNLSIIDLLMNAEPRAVMQSLHTGDG